MDKLKIEKFSLTAIADAVRGSDAKSALSAVVGAVLDVSGKVRKVVKREGQCKLVIEPGEVPGFVVFADCPGELENLRKLKIRKGLTVAIRGELQTFGAAAVCLTDCRIIGKK